jgi:hypothetical protein
MSKPEFHYGRSLFSGAYQWYCQTAGSRWATDPVVGWELYLTAEGTGPATWYLIGHGAEINTGEITLKKAMIRAQAEIAKRSEPEALPETWRVQPASFTDQIRDGQELTKQPYPFFVDRDGWIGRQDFWQGKFRRVIGVVNDSASMRIDAYWPEVRDQPHLWVRSYLVLEGSGGRWFTFDHAIESITVEGAQRPGEE